MNYADVLLLIEERQEKILAQSTHSLVTDKNHYLRLHGEWTQDQTPGSPEKKYTREGEVYFWKRAENV
jgi:hypothetical protein